MPSKPLQADLPGHYKLRKLICQASHYKLRKLRFARPLQAEEAEICQATAS